MLKYLAEFIGTFIFLSVILNIAGQTKMAALAIGLALATAVWWGGDISGGHFNPAVSTMFYLDDKLTRNDLIPYVIAQVLGGAAALHFSKMVAKGY